MNNIELTIQRKTDSGYPVIAALTRPGGFLPPRREGLLNLDITALSELQYDPLAYGTALGQALFVNEIRDTFREGLAGGEPLRVLLSIEAPDLRAIDWHRLAAPFDGRWRCLASQQNTPFSLSIPSPASAHFPALGRRDLRALLLVAGPESLSGDYKLAPFDVPGTIAGIQTALGDIPCDVLPNPSLDALCAALTATPYTILHLVCHGAVHENGETILYFPKDDRRTPTLATELLNRLSSLARLPHFAFISACESALPKNGLGSLAGRLVRELGLPAVLAMTDRVSIATASSITAPFYTHLYQHGQPDLALAQSLAGLQGAHDLTVPTIFSRLGDRPLFDDNSERTLTDKELEFGLNKLAESLPERAPVMEALRDSLTSRLRSTLGVDSKSLSESRRTECKETLDKLNSLSLEALDLFFNALCLGQTPPIYDSRSPFRGLESFRPKDAAYFFGRETLTRKLVQKLNEHNFLSVLGASGSGKSSLVMAGLIPALNLPYIIFRPGAEPISELDAALQSLPQLLVVDQFEELFTLSAREQRSEFISRLLEQSQKIRVVITLRADFLGDVAPFKSLKDEVQNHQEIIPPMDEAELRRAMEGQATCAGLRFESDLSQQMLDDVAGEPGAMPLLQHALWTLWTRRHGRWLRAEEYRAFGGVKQAIASTAEAVFAHCTEFEKEHLRDIFVRLTRLDESADGRDTRRRVLLRDLIPADSDPAATTLLIKQLADARLVVVTGDEVEVAHEALIRHWERLRAWLNDDRDNLRLREGVSDDARRWENAARDESLLNHRGARLELALAMSKNPRYLLNPVEQMYLDRCVGLREREKAAAARRRKYSITGISVTLMVIMAILAGWGWTSTNSANEKATQVVIAQTAQADAERRANESRSSQLASLSKENINFRPDLAMLLAIESFNIVDTPASRIALFENIMQVPRLRRYIWSPIKPSTSCGVAGSWRCSAPYNEKVLTYNSATQNFALTGELTNKQSTILLWNVLDEAFVNQSPLIDEPIASITFHSNGEYIAAGGHAGNIYLWDIKANTISKYFTGKHTDLYNIEFLSTENTLIISTDQDILFLDYQNNWLPKRAPISFPSGIIKDFSISPDGKQIAISGCPTVVAIGYNVETGHFDDCPEKDRSISVWKIYETVNDPFLEMHLPNYEYGTISLEFNPNGTEIVTWDTNSVARWDLLEGTVEPSMFNVQEGIITDVAYSLDGRSVFIANCTKYSSIALQTPLNCFESKIVKINLTELHYEDFSFSYPSKSAILAVEQIPDINALAMINYDGRIDLINLEKFEDTIISDYHISEGVFERMKAYSPDLKWLVHAEYGDEIIITNLEDLNDAYSLKIPGSDYISSLVFNSRNLLAISRGGYTVFWDAARKSFIGEPIRGVSPYFSPSGEFVVVIDEVNSNLFRWENISQGYPEIHELDNILPVSSVVFSPDSRKIAIISGKNKDTVKIWDLDQLKLVEVLVNTGNLKTIFSEQGVYFVSIENQSRREQIDQVSVLNIRNANGFNVLTRYLSVPESIIKYEQSMNDYYWDIDLKSRIILGARWYRIFLWDIENGSFIGSLSLEDDDGLPSAFYPDTLLSSESKKINIGFNGLVKYSINIDPVFWRELLCQKVGRNFSEIEWVQYFPGEPYQATCPQWLLESVPTATPTP